MTIPAFSPPATAAAIGALRNGGWLCFDDLQNERWPDVDMVWRQLVKLRHASAYESQSMGFVMRERMITARHKQPQQSRNCPEG